MTLGPSVDVRVPPTWRLARARRLYFLFGSLNLALNCEYVLEVQGRNVSTSGTTLRVDIFRGHIECFPRTYLNKIDPPGPPDSEDLALLT